MYDHEDSYDDGDDYEEDDISSIFQLKGTGGKTQHLLHVILFLDAPMDVVQRVVALDPYGLQSLANQHDLPLHAACNYSPRNILQVLNGYPVAASQAFANGYLPIESYMLTHVPFRREAHVVEELLKATNVEVLIRKDVFRVCCSMLGDTIFKDRDDAASCAAATAAEDNDDDDELNEYWQILMLVLRALSTTRESSSLFRNGNGSRRNANAKTKTNGPTAQRDLARFALRAVMEDRPMTLSQQQSTMETMYQTHILEPFILRCKDAVVVDDDDAAAKNASAASPLNMLLKHSRCCNNQVFADARRTAIHALLQADARVATMPSGGSVPKLPLHVAIDRGISWKDGVEAIAMAGPSKAMETRNRQTLMHPFMAAAVGRGSDMNSVYCLLKENPEVARGLASLNR